jgi:hypothetical protein
MVQFKVVVSVTSAFDNPITVPLALLPPEHPAGVDPITAPVTLRRVPSETRVTVPLEAGIVVEEEEPGTDTVVPPAVQVLEEIVMVSIALLDETVAA